MTSDPVTKDYDLISRQVAIEAFDGAKVDEQDCTEYDIGYNDGIDFAVSRLSVLPSAQPERKEGRWGDSFCSVCGVSKYNFIKMLHIDDGYRGTWNYCPNCGADMRGEQK